MLNFTERQKEILEKSMQIISDKGIENMTIKNISKNIGVTEPAIYRHFESKSEIFLGILDLFAEDIIQFLDYLKKQKYSAFKKIELIFWERIEKFIKHPQYSVVIFAEEMFPHDQRITEKIVSIMDIHKKAFLNLLQTALSNNEIRTDIESDQMCLILMGSLRLLVKKWRQSGFKFDLNFEGKKLLLSIRILFSN